MFIAPLGTTSELAHAQARLLHSAIRLRLGVAESLLVLRMRRRRLYPFAAVRPLVPPPGLSIGAAQLRALYEICDCPTTAAPQPSVDRQWPHDEPLAPPVDVLIVNPPQPDVVIVLGTLLDVFT